ncbi:MAG: hypothetical protein AAGA90_04800 [Actinomycetota bacterium]
MNRRTADDDPGWKPVVKLLPTLVIPFLGMRAMTTQNSGLQATRLLWLVFVNAIVVIWIPVVALAATGGAPVSISTGVTVTAIIGVGLMLVAPRFVPSPNGSSPTELARSFQRATLVRIGFAQGAAITGFVLFLATGSWIVYGTGFLIACYGMWRAAPRASLLEATQSEIREAGSDLHLIRVLNTTRLTR